MCRRRDAYGSAASLLDQSDEWVTQRSRYMTLETVAAVSDTGHVRLSAVPA
jgi:hypothetical protein